MKVVRDNDHEKLRAHENEFQILSRLKHRNIVGAVEIFKDYFKNEVYQVMEFVEGHEILDTVASMGCYDEADAQFIYRQILEGIAYMHQQRICHRDIKPSNILITKEKRVYIADFNVAKHCPLKGRDFTASYDKRPSLLFDDADIIQPSLPMVPGFMGKNSSEQP